MDSLDITSCKKKTLSRTLGFKYIYLHLPVTMTEQQGTPDQLPAEKDQGGAGATYKVHFFSFPEIKVIIKNMTEPSKDHTIQFSTMFTVGHF